MQDLKEVTLYKNHDGQIGDWLIKAVSLEPHLEGGAAQLQISHTKVVGGKAVTKIVPVEGKNIGRANETTPAQQAVLELDSRVNKQLDKGYVRTLEAATAPATNSLGLEKPMLAHPIDKVKPEAIDWDDAWGQPKLDGHRCLVNGIMYSRNGKEILLPHIRDFLGDHSLLDKKLDGELYVHGHLLQDIGSLIKKPREESLQLQYHVYDVISPASYADRHAWLADVMSSALADGDSPVRLVPAVRVASRDELTKLHAAWLEAGYEGSMLRHGKAGYQADKRSASLLKVKDFEDIEATVIGVERGTPNGEFEVPVWSLMLPNGKQFKATAHGDMQQKHAQWEMRHTYLHRQLTVQIFGYSKDGIPLLPVALRWREDV